MISPENSDGLNVWDFLKKNGDGIVKEFFTKRID